MHDIIPPYSSLPYSSVYAEAEPSYDIYSHTDYTQCPLSSGLHIFCFLTFLSQQLLKSFIVSISFLSYSHPLNNL